jgi:transcriptional regulator with XRE-family HTH domain
MSRPARDSVPEFTRGDRMRIALREAGITGGEMAEYLDVGRWTVSTWLNDRNKPSTAVMRVWALRTGAPYEWLCAIRDSNPEPADYVTAAGQGLILPVLLPMMRAA